MPRLAATVFLLAALSAAAQTPAPPGRMIDVGGYRVHLYCTGQPGPTVLVAGAGYSFDWGLVQPEAARFTTICTYDVSGTAWSDAGPVLTCRERVNEVHQLIHAAGLATPLVLAGLSLGACVVRLYAAVYPEEVAGMVIVDHAFQPDPDPESAPSQPGAHPEYDTPPVLLYQEPIAVTVEQSSNFQRLPARIQQLHRWADSLHPQVPTWERAEDCLAQLKSTAPGPYPLGNRPLVVVRTGNQARGYDRLQSELLALSHRSLQMTAERSFHQVEIDQPEVVVEAIRRVIGQLRPR